MLAPQPDNNLPDFKSLEPDITGKFPNIKFQCSTRAEQRLLGILNQLMDGEFQRQDASFAIDFEPSSF